LRSEDSLNTSVSVRMPPTSAPTFFVDDGGSGGGGGEGGPVSSPTYAPTLYNEEPQLSLVDNPWVLSFFLIGVVSLLAGAGYGIFYFQEGRRRTGLAASIRAPDCAFDMEAASAHGLVSFNSPYNTYTTTNTNTTPTYPLRQYQPSSSSLSPFHTTRLASDATDVDMSSSSSNALLVGHTVPLASPRNTTQIAHPTE
jgi:hypothetical protein